MQDVEGHPGAVTLLQGSLLVEGKVGFFSSTSSINGTRKSLEGFKTSWGCLGYTWDYTTQSIIRIPIKQPEQVVTSKAYPCAPMSLDTFGNYELPSFVGLP